MNGRRIEVRGACPLDCPDGCAWVVTVEDGLAVKLRGNPDHPFTQGGLCKKVNPWLTYAEDPGRLLHPLRRVAPKGQPGDPAQTFERITWGEAIGEMADRFRLVIDRSGPAAIWPFAGTGNMGFVHGAGLPSGSRLWNHLGVSDHDGTICSVSGHVGLGYTMGVACGLDPEDVVDAGLVVIWGSNTLIANQHWWPFVEQARDRGAAVVVIDPVKTRTAARADHHVAPRPGTDGALALGLCKAVMDREVHDAAFLADRTVGFDEFAASLAPWTVAATAEVCGLEVAEVERLADLIAERTPLAVKLGQGMQRSAHGGQTARIVSALAAMVGAFDRPGGGLVYSTGPGYRFNIDAAAGTHLGHRPRSLAMTNLVANLTELNDPPVELLFIHGANPVVSNPDSDGVKAALGRHDLYTVAVDVFHTETTEYADLVLPSTMQHEQLEVNDSFSHLYVDLNLPAVDPPGECLPHAEIFRRLATALGVTEPAVLASDRELAAALFDTPDFAAAGITLDTLERDGFARLPGTARPYRPFSSGFPTPSGCFEFVSERAEADGHGRLPHYRPPVESAGPGAGYDLVAAASDHYLNSTFAGTERVRSRTSRPVVAIHPLDADRDRLSDGDMVTIGNDRGSFTATLAVNDTARPGLAVTTKGWWGMGVNATVAERDSDMGRGAVYHDNRVTITLSPPDD